MLTYTITKNVTLGIITDILSGLAVIGIPLLLFPIFNTDEHKYLDVNNRHFQAGHFFVNQGKKN